MHIFHITDQKTWQAAKNEPEYIGDSLNTDGFIHCCTSEQIDGVLRNWFAGKENLVIVEIDPEAIAVAVKYENLEGGEELFPHVYGPVNMDAVISEKYI